MSLLACNYFLGGIKEFVVSHKIPYCTEICALKHTHEIISISSFSIHRV